MDFLGVEAVIEVRLNFFPGFVHAALSQFLIVNHPVDRLRKCRRVIRFAQQSGPFVRNGLRYTAQSAPDHRKPGGHRLHDHVRETVPVSVLHDDTRHDEQIRPAVMSRNVFMGYFSHELDFILKPQVSNQSPQSLFLGPTADDITLKLEVCFQPVTGAD